jgi:hypothetical protein
MLDLIGLNGEMTAGKALFGILVVLALLLFVLVLAGA